MRLRAFFPRGLLGRTVLILVLPVIAIQVIVSIAFIQRYFEGVTRLLSASVLNEVNLVLKTVDTEKSLQHAKEKAQLVSRDFGMYLWSFPSENTSLEDKAHWTDLTSDSVLTVLNEKSHYLNLLAIDLITVRGIALLDFQTKFGPLRIAIPRDRLSPPNPHQLFVIMLLASTLMIFIAYVFMRNQLRPIAALAIAAEAFGRGENIPYHPRGANEVRAAGRAFIDMRNRIERTIETRTLMLSAISHDLRTPLTRLRLELALLPQNKNIKAMLADISEMEYMVDEFLDFVRSDTKGEPEEIVPSTLLSRIVESSVKAGQNVSFVLPSKEVGRVRLYPQAIKRAIENLINNAMKYGKKAEIRIKRDGNLFYIFVEDDGPGIAKEYHDTVTMPFVRLDNARNRNKDSGVGLGLSIVSDTARAHGGHLKLGKSETLGGLSAEFCIAC